MVNKKTTGIISIETDFEIDKEVLEMKISDIIDAFIPNRYNYNSSVQLNDAKRG